MPIRLLSIFLAVTLTAITTSHAQPTMAPQLLSFDEALSITLNENPLIEALESERMAAQRTTESTIGLFLPQIRLRGAYIYTDRDIAFSLNNQLTAMLGLNLSYTLQPRSFGALGGDITIPIFTGGKIIAARRAAKAQEYRTNANITQRINALYTEVATRYFGYVLAIHALQIRKQVVTTISQHLKDLQVAEANGMATRTELLYAQYRFAEAQREQESATLQLQTIQTALASTLGQDCTDTESFHPIYPITSTFIINELPPLDYYLSIVDSQSPILQDIEGDRALAKANVAAHRAEFFPEIVGMGAVSLYDFNITPILPRAAVGVGVNFPIFNGARRELSYSAARHTLRRVESLQQQASNEIRTLITQLYNQICALRSQCHALAEGITSAEAYLHSTRIAFKEGVATTADLLDAETKVAQIRIERVEIAYNFDTTLAKLLEAVGESEQLPQLIHSSASHSITYDTPPYETH